MLKVFICQSNRRLKQLQLIITHYQIYVPKNKISFLIFINFPLTFNSPNCTTYTFQQFLSTSDSLFVGGLYLYIRLNFQLNLKKNYNDHTCKNSNSASECFISSCQQLVSNRYKNYSVIMLQYSYAHKMFTIVGKLQKLFAIQKASYCSSISLNFLKTSNIYILLKFDGSKGIFCFA